MNKQASRGQGVVDHSQGFVHLGRGQAVQNSLLYDAVQTFLLGPLFGHVNHLPLDTSIHYLLPFFHLVYELPTKV